MTNFDVLRCIMAIGKDIDYAAQSLALSDFCPNYRANRPDCDPVFEDCTECWKHHLEKEVHVVNYVK